MAGVRAMNGEERAKWSRAIHRAMRDDAMPALRAAYAMLTPFIDEGCQTMYTDGYFRVGVNPDFFRGLSDRQAAYLVMHETMHNTQRHRQRYVDTGANHMRWIIACDLEINSMLALGVARIRLGSNGGKDVRAAGGWSWIPEGALLPSMGSFATCPANLTAEAYLTYISRVTETVQNQGDEGEESDKDTSNESARDESGSSDTGNSSQSMGSMETETDAGTSEEADSGGSASSGATATEGNEESGMNGAGGPSASGSDASSGTGAGSATSQMADTAPDGAGSSMSGAGGPGSANAHIRSYEVRLKGGTAIPVVPGAPNFMDCVPEAGVWEAADELGIEQIHATDMKRTMERVRHDIEEERKKLEGYGRDTKDEALRLMLASMEPPKVDWQGVLRRVVGASLDEIRRGRDDYQLGRPNRRRLYDDSFILPAYVAYQPRVLYAIDTSGSMTDTDLARVAFEAEGILRELGGKLECVSIDAEVKGLPRTYSCVRELLDNLEGGGGTDMSEALYLVDSLPRPRRPDLLVIATDGYWSWRDFGRALRLPSIRGLPVVVVLTDEGFVRSWKQRECGKLVGAGNVMVVDAT